VKIFIFLKVHKENIEIQKDIPFYEYGYDSFLSCVVNNSFYRNFKLFYNKISCFIKKLKDYKFIRYLFSQVHILFSILPFHTTKQSLKVDFVNI